MQVYDICLYILYHSITTGSGKTTLLNILAKRSPSSRVPVGCVQFHGYSETNTSSKPSVNYVMAHEKMLPYLTVHETLVSMADLKIPHLPKEERRLRVEAIIESMSLERCRNSFIGGEWKKGISTGNKQ